MQASSPAPVFSTVFLKTTASELVVTVSGPATALVPMLRLVKSSLFPVRPTAAGDPQGPIRTPATSALRFIVSALSVLADNNISKARTREVIRIIVETFEIKSRGSRRELLAGCATRPGERHDYILHCAVGRDSLGAPNCLVRFPRRRLHV